MNRYKWYANNSHQRFSGMQHTDLERGKMVKVPSLADLAGVDLELVGLDPSILELLPQPEPAEPYEPGEGQYL